ncbi:hypothetical protein DU000_05325 [Parvibium lacunae]|uniref:Uncharacterized protein n=1 Tax=Parvibium lacunae TaxID=1888893 RepID=A0A368L3T8_9BURK|nr:hypothetical protein DU000_05325 [Parvibium lacunae]
MTFVSHDESLPLQHHSWPFTLFAPKRGPYNPFGGRLMYNSSAGLLGTCRCADNEHDAIVFVFRLPFTTFCERTIK